ncbi:amino acid ABC transporter permease [Clostridium cylindrosporum]|uniref:Inner membrane amino-acid ABC transporter permease protein YecS n=1 Tax=Clostridium cylindrosporum DSM 605 TaxID=1121307 RepID=A0A0J8DA00_CLOCY|nr:amino acid ABC transporter permease [Clostridium cylindrosporum]KMT21123.1 inner membrane amino-acid ABC transporter permease protein YecS [Clostridium cylindrosporum DSM 605]
MEYILQSTKYILTEGLTLTLAIFALTIVTSIPLGLLVAIGKIFGKGPIKAILEFYTWLFRGTPLLLQLFFAYYGLALIGIVLTPFEAAAITFALNYGAYLGEIFRAGIESIEKGQYEASEVLGMTKVQTMIRIILPQTIKRVLPPLCNETITLIKDTSLLAAVSMGDILRATNQLSNRDGNITPYVIAAVIYLILTYVVVFIFGKFEKRLSIYE